jgi:pimeloyl-ACP methyl ester carboxylesterase
MAEGCLEGFVTNNVAGGELAIVHKHGFGVPIIFLHGNSSCKEIFRDLWKILTNRGIPLVACDLPGHGASRDAVDPQARYTFPGYAEVVTALLDWGKWDRAILFGWSLGGHIAMETMISNPKVTACLVIGSPPGKPSVEAFEAAFNDDALTKLAGQESFSAADALRYVKAMLGTASPDPFFVEMARRTDGLARKHLLESVANGLGHDQRLALAQPSRPTCVLVGEADPFLRQAYFRSLDARTMWRGKVHVLRGHGHAPHWNPSREFVEIVEAFLTDAIA